MDQVNLIPGYDYIGRGFDAFSSFDATALTSKQRLFNSSTPSEQTYDINDKVFSVPQNVGVMEVQSRDGQAHEFSQKSDFSEFLSAKVGIEGSYLAFSAAFKASFDSISQSVSEFQFGLYDIYTDGFALALKDSSRSQLLPSVLNDPDFQNLPIFYSQDNSHLFYRFFEKYGTHFVSSVEMGGRLFYSVAIDKSYNFSSIDFEAKLTAEYKAVFGAKAEAEINWTSIGEVWTDNRIVTINAVGGDDSILNALVKPEPPQNFDDTFTHWLSSWSMNPGPMNFTLMGIESLFSGDQHEAVKAAAQAYNQQHLLIEAQGGSDLESTTGNIILNGLPLMSPDFKDGGLTAAIIDRSSLEPIFTGIYKIDWRNTPNGGSYDYQDAMIDLSEFLGNTNIIAALLFWGQYSTWGHPTGDFYNFLRSIGAGSGLDKWTSWDTSASCQFCSYSIVGIPGWASGQAIETYVGAGNFNYDFPVDGSISYPSLSTEVDFKPEYINGELVYTPT
jgi:MAC/Perforin domain